MGEPRANRVDKGLLRKRFTKERERSGGERLPPRDRIVVRAHEDHRELPLCGQEVPLTAQHFLTYRTEASSVADGTYWIKRVPRPILIVRDEADGLIEPFEPYMLVSAATAAGSLVPSIKFVLLANPRPRGPAGHGFVDNRQPLIDTVSAWLAEQHL